MVSDQDPSSKSFHYCPGGTPGHLGMNSKAVRQSPREASLTAQLLSSLGSRVWCDTSDNMKTDPFINIKAAKQDREFLLSLQRGVPRAGSKPGQRSHWREKTESVPSAKQAGEVPEFSTTSSRADGPCACLRHKEISIKRPQNARL